jgi:hypothetical protein
MAEALLYNLGINSSGYEHRGVRLPEVMECEVGETVLGDHLLQYPFGEVSVQRLVKVSSLRINTSFMTTMLNDSVVTPWKHD